MFPKYRYGSETSVIIKQFIVKLSGFENALIYIGNRLCDFPSVFGYRGEVICPHCFLPYVYFFSNFRFLTSGCPGARVCPTVPVRGLQTPLPHLQQRQGKRRKWTSQLSNCLRFFIFVFPLRIHTMFSCYESKISRQDSRNTHHIAFTRLTD